MDNAEIVDSLITILNTLESVANGQVLHDYIDFKGMAAELHNIVVELKARMGEPL